MTPSEVIKMAHERGVKFVDLRFMDFIGTQQHFTVPVHELTDELFSEGHGFDGSSIRGWKGIQESDMLTIPDPATAYIDPFIEEPTLALVCSIADPITREKYPRDPRNTAIKAEEYLKATGLGDTVYVGPELEFFLFSEMRFGSASNYSSYFVDSPEAIWNSNRDERSETGIPNLGGKIRHKEGYFPLPPVDTLQDVRNDMVLRMMEAGIEIETHHHEVATAGQCEIDMRFDTLVRMADKSALYKYIVKQVARQYDLTANFMPKPLFGDNGSGMHTHMSIWKGGKNLMAGNGYAGLSEFSLYFIGGILKHARAILAFSNPTTNSYRRLVPGYEAPVNLAYSARNRSAAIRIPTYQSSEKGRRVEFRCPDPAANPYYCFAAILMAGLDGVQNKIDPGPALDKNIYDLPPEELKLVPKACGSLTESLDALAEDHDFLTRGDVFTTDVVEAWIDYKVRSEVDPIRIRPHPYEFYLYSDC
ncbi:MAG: type I glutamate--ammonia ligase [Candidatus Sumerlaeia bacterium]|nr:type I glutamate--ammonia ligase [Candidatus Sumerlaeia bacterium]